MSRKHSKSVAGTLCALFVGAALVASIAPASAHTDSSSDSKSGIAMDYKPRKGKFVGKVTSEHGACVEGRTVKLFKARTGKKVGRTTTNATGGWSIAAAKRSGKYYSKVTASDVTLDTGVDKYGDTWVHSVFCMGARSGVEVSR